MPIDLNADLGEGFGRWTLGDDDALLDVITSANVACGFHAGDPTIMRRVCAQATERGVAIGAQVGYRDLAGFGRRRIEIARSDLTADVLYQLGALEAFARAAGTSVRYLKPHGALYNTAVTDPESAGAIVDAIRACDGDLPVLTLPGSELARQATAAGITVVAEGFVDRNYTATGELVPRGEPHAVLDDPTQIAERAVSMVRTGDVPTVDGSTVAVNVQSLCVHGDSPQAVDIARAVRDALKRHGIELKAFATG